MTTRISENQTQRGLIAQTLANKKRLNQYSKEVSSGLKVALPGDSTDSGTVSRYQQTLRRIEGYTTTVAQTKNILQFQDSVMTQMNELIIRAKEVATQGANETLSVSARAHLAEEIYQIRDHVASLGNSAFQGRYIFGGADDEDPPFDPSTYAVPASGTASVRYVFDGELGTAVTRTVDLTENLNITINTPGNELFSTTIEALERLGRSLGGYNTLPATGTPTGAGAAYSMPTDYPTQTADIKKCIDLLDTAREQEILPERVSLGGRMRRIETAEALLGLTKNSAEEVLGRIQNVDETESASNLARAQTALESSYTVTAKVLRMSILDYI
jgi:flagellar hook-associated protein 3 FlgL